jgi:hypothetical protein
MAACNLKSPQTYLVGVALGVGFGQLVAVAQLTGVVLAQVGSVSGQATSNPTVSAEIDPIVALRQKQPCCRPIKSPLPAFSKPLGNDQTAC